MSPPHAAAAVFLSRPTTAVFLSRPTTAASSQCSPQRLSPHLRYSSRTPREPGIRRSKVASFCAGDVLLGDEALDLRAPTICCRARRRWICLRSRCSSTGDRPSRPPSPTARRGEEGCRAWVALLDAYKLGRSLGEGSFGKVKLARRRDTGDHFAVEILKRGKLLSLRGADDQVRMEIATLTLLRHPPSSAYTSRRSGRGSGRGSVGIGPRRSLASTSAAYTSPRVLVSSLLVLSLGLISVSVPRS